MKYVKLSDIKELDDDAVADIRVRLDRTLLDRIDALPGTRSEVIAQLLEESFEPFDMRGFVKGAVDKAVKTALINKILNG